MESEPTELEFINQQVSHLQILLEALPQKLEDANFQVKRRIEDLQKEAGIAGEVKGLEDKVESLRRSLQSQADQILGKIEALGHIKEVYHKPDYSHLIPAGVTHMHGLDLSEFSHDVETLSLIMEGSPATIEALGGSAEDVAPVTHGCEEDIEESQDLREREELDLLDGVL